MEAGLQEGVELLAREIAGQARTVEDVNGLLRLMMKAALERMLDTALDVRLGRRPVPESIGALADSTGPAPSLPAAEAGVSSKAPNRRNGRSKKTVRSDSGELTLATPRDRDGTFQPQLIEKHQRRVPGFDEKIVSLWQP